MPRQPFVRRPSLEVLESRQVLSSFALFVPGASALSVLVQTPALSAPASHGPFASLRSESAALASTGNGATSGGHVGLLRVLETPAADSPGIVRRLASIEPPAPSLPPEIPGQGTGPVVLPGQGGGTGGTVQNPVAPVTTGTAAALPQTSSGTTTTKSAATAQAVATTAAANQQIAFTSRLLREVSPANGGTGEAAAAATNPTLAQQVPLVTTLLITNVRATNEFTLAPGASEEQELLPENGSEQPMEALPPPAHRLESEQRTEPPADFSQVLPSVVPALFGPMDDLLAPGVLFNLTGSTGQADQSADGDGEATAVDFSWTTLSLAACSAAALFHRGLRAEVRKRLPARLFQTPAA